MKRTVLVGAIALLTSITASSQNPKPEIRDGLTVNMTVNTWVNALIGDQKFLKAKPEKKEDLVAARNEAVMAGSIAPNKFPLTYKITQEGTQNGIDNYRSTTTISGKDYSSYVSISKDTMYIYRSKGITPLEANGESWGFTQLGTEKIPLNITVGDVLPVYEDFGASYPKTTIKVVKEWEDAGRADWLHSWMTQVNTEVLRTTVITSQSFNNVNSKVTRTENVTVNGKSYNAFVIESESWGKATANETFESSRKGTAKAQAKLDKKMDDKAAKKLVKMGFTNEDGFIVTSKEEWFVPQLGVVKLRAYDMYGAISSETIVDSIR